MTRAQDLIEARVEAQRVQPLVEATDPQIMALAKRYGGRFLRVGQDTHVFLFNAATMYDFIDAAQESGFYASPRGGGDVEVRRMA